MRRCFKLLSCLLSAIVCLSLITADTAVSLAAGTEAEDAAESLYDLGLFVGTGTTCSGTPDFDLDRAPTRNEAVTMLVRLLGKEQVALSGTWNTPFTDVAEWAKPYVGYAYENRLTGGTSASTYSGELLVTPSQYITFVLRALGYSSSIDFQWDKAWLLSDRLGITHGEYTASSTFTRGNLAIISNRALSATLKDSSTTLLQSLSPGNTAEALPTSNSSLEVHFIDVGQADAALVLCDDHAMLIDGGNVSDSSRIYTYLKTHSVDYLDYIVCTHPHEDHVGGLAGALNYAKVGTAFCSMMSYDSKAFDSFVSYLARQGKSITIPNAGDTFQLGAASVQVIGPIRRSDNVNNMSIVLRVTYGNTSFLFTGDAERDEEQDILNAGYSLRSTVLKVGHHGSSDSTTYPFLREILPEFAVISVGQENPYGHPTDNTLSRLRDADVHVYRTDMQGDIICVSDGSTVRFTTEKNETADTLSNAGSTIDPGSNAQNSLSGQQSTDIDRSGAVHSYVLNVNTHVFHYSDCTSVTQMSEKNKAVFEGTREDAIALGYSPCGRCKP